MSNTIHLFTTKIPHHATHSGYEQLVKYLPEAEIIEFKRGHAKSMFKHIIERVTRFITCSKWYQWDSFQFEKILFSICLKRKETVYAHFLYGDTSIGWIPYIKNYLNLHLTITVHTCPSDMDEVFQKPKLLKAVDAIILLGSNQKAFFLNHGIAEEKLHLIPHGVDNNFFKPAEKKEDFNGQRPFKIIMVGAWRRNFALYQKVIKAFESDDSVIFEIITHEHNHHLFDNFSNAKMRSGLKDEALLEMYQTADLLLLGLEDAVANNVLLEAMSTKLPVLAENIGAIPEYITEDEGYFFAKNDVEACKRKINEIKLNYTSAIEKTERAYQRVKNQFRWDKVANLTQSVIQPQK